MHLLQMVHTRTKHDDRVVPPELAFHDGQSMRVSISIPVFKEKERKRGK
jgi:hypothetical protein